MRFYSFKQHMYRARAALSPRDSWCATAREALLAEIRKDPLWQEAPVSVRDHASFAQLFNSLFAQAALKPALAGFLIFAVVSYSSVSTVQAARASLPGEPLYSVKLGIERAQIGVAFSESKKAELEISFATTRLAEVNEILEQDPAVANTPHIEQAIRRFSSDLDSVQKRLEKLGQEEKSEETVLKISKLVNDKTSELEENLLVIKEKLADQKAEAALSDAFALAPDAPPAPLTGGAREESAAASGADLGVRDLATQNDSATSTSTQALGELSTTTTTAASETTSVAQSQNAKAADTAAEKDLLTTLNNALDVVDETNIKSLEVFVGKAQASTSEAVQQEAVDKVQKKIEKVEKTIDAALSDKVKSAELAPLSSPQKTDGASASSTQPVFEKASSAAAPEQIKEAINEAKKILDNKNIQELGQAVEKVKEVKAIVKDAAAATADGGAQQNSGFFQKQNQDTKTGSSSISASSTPGTVNQLGSSGSNNTAATSVQESVGDKKE
ncbi:MAG: hypothetical protein HYW81_00475 [Parcubacteria group bacterium]|nr:hypothetical protein [Parcubacteria group bacterium]